MDVKQLCKRFICGLAAVSMMLFAVFFTPFRGSALDLEAFINAAIDFGYSAGNQILDKFALVPGMSIPVNYAAKPVLDLGYQFFKGDGYADQARGIWTDFRNQGNFSEIDVNTSQCLSGLYSRNGSVHTVSIFSFSDTSIDVNHYIPLVSCEDYHVLLQLVPYEGYGAEDYSVSLGQTISSTSIQYTIRSSPILSYRVILFSNGDYISRLSTPFNSDSNGFYCTFSLNFSDSSVPVVLPDSATSLLALFCPPNNDRGNVSVTIGSCSSGLQNVYEFPHADQYNSFTEDNIYNYYQNDVYPYIVNEYPEITFNSPQYYYEINNPTEPTETGEAAPFTLPPEWLEDRVELETDHYTVPYTDLVQDPWEYIQGQATTTSTTSTTELLRAGSPGEDTWTETLPGVLHADPAIMTSLWDFENFAQELLSRSGLWAIFAGLAAAGICIRLISLH